MSIIRFFLTILLAVTLFSGPAHADIFFPITGGGGVQEDTTPSFNGVKLNTGQSPSHDEGLIFYDDVNKTIAWFNDESDTTMQGGQELWGRFVNATGAQIDNGAVVYISGESGGLNTVLLARSDAASTSIGTIAIATHDVGIGAIGIFTKAGTVRGLDTTALGFSAGDELWLSTTTAGAIINTQPTSPNFSVFLGNAGVIDGTVGTIEVSINVRGNVRDTVKIFNGAILEDHEITITESGGTVSLNLEKAGGGDLNLFFNGAFQFFAAAPATVALDDGTDISPKLNYVFIPESTNTLTANISGFPEAQHVPIATVLVQSAASVATDAAYKIHAWTDHLSNSYDQGHLSDLNRWIRNQHATYLTGVSPTFSGDGTGTIGLSVTSGTILQLHEHDFPVFSDPATIYAFNDPDTAYREITNIGDLQKDSTGASLTNKTYALVFWGVVNEVTGESKIYVNLPSGSEGANKADKVREDKDKEIDYSIPDEFKGTGFLIYRLVIENDSDTTWDLYVGGTGDDIRGQFPNTQAGSATAIGTEFPTSTFRIQDTADNSKEIAFDATGITPSTTRTITMPDADVDLGALAAKESTDTFTAALAIESSTDATFNISEATHYGGTAVNGDADAQTQELDAALPGMSIMLSDDAGGVITADPNGTDIIIYDNEAGAAGAAFESSGTKGDYIILRCLTAGEWTSLGHGINVWLEE